MPGYSGTGQATTVLPNRSMQLFTAEIVAPGTASISVLIGQGKGVGRTGFMSVSVLFAADPGAYEIDVEAADDDVDVQYVPISQLGSGASATTAAFASRVDLQTPGARFLRVRVVTLTNPVPLTVVLSRN